jgi:hypothetical protein
MTLRVLRSDSQGRWKDGQPSWDLAHHRRKQSENRTGRDDQGGATDPSEGSLYNAKGDLVAPVSSLKINI